MENKTLYQKLHIIQSKINGLGKDGKSFGYKYVTGTKVLSEIKPLMNELGIILKQEVLSIENERQDYSTKNGSKSEILSKVMMRFTWIDTVTGEKDENSFGANGQNDWEKGLGSALTYAERYFLLKFFHIATDDDDIDNSERKPIELEAEQKENEEYQKANEAILKQQKANEMLIYNAENLDSLKAIFLSFDAKEQKRVENLKDKRKNELTTIK